MPATLRDVAIQADVSIKTVSNVVHGRLGRVSPATADRVRAALTSLDYHPNLAARYLRNGQAGVLALVVPSLTNPYFASLCAAFIEAAAVDGYTVLIDHTGGDWTQEALAFKGLRPHLIDGVILSPVALNAEDVPLQEAVVPVVLLGERLYDTPYDHVAIDNVAAARAATEHLLKLGRRRIAAMGVMRGRRNGVSVMRLRGYREALRAAGQTVDSRLIAPIEPSGCEFTRRDGARAMLHLLELDPPPDAVFCFNDVLALGAIKALNTAGYRVPEDVAVVGFDDIEDAQYSIPSLTTIAPDLKTLARTAVSMLVDRVRRVRTGDASLVHPPFRLVVRASTSGQERVEDWV